MSLTILFQSFGLDVEDIVKFPTLVKHFSSHLEQGDTLSSFMDLHYGVNVETHQNKHNEHKELPFKHQHTDTHFQLVYVVNFNNIEMTASEIMFENKNFHYKKAFSNSYTNRLFQPPQK